MGRRLRRRRVLLALDVGASGRRRVGIAQYAHEAGWIVDAGLLGFLPEELPKGHAGRLEVDGILSSLRKGDRVLRELVGRARVPVVDLGQTLPEVKLPRVWPDHAGAGRLAAEHLMDVGLRRLVFYGHAVWHPAPGKRWEGFRAAARARGAACEAWWWESGGRLGGRIGWLAKRLRECGGPLGVMGGNDVMAMEVVEAAVEAGLRVSEEVAVIGADNDEIVTELGVMPLTSVDAAQDRVGYEAAALLDRLMGGGRAPGRVVLVAPAGVVVRQSTERAAVADPHVARAVAYIREHFRGRLQVERIAAEAYVSRRRLQDLFLRTLGHGMADEIARQRLELSKMLLRQTTHKIAAIAGMAGFGSVARLNKTFRRKEGMAPGEYRGRYQRVVLEG